MIIHSTFGYVTCVASPQFGFELCSKGLTKLLLPSTVLFLSMILWFYILHVFTRDDSSQLGLNLSKGITKLSLPAIAMLL